MADVKTEKGVIIVAYKPSRRNNRFAVLKRKKNWEGWELPKGHLENDDYEETVKIELEEECGIEEENIEKIEEVDHTVSWKYERDGEQFQKQYRTFLVEVSEEASIDVSKNPDEEHSQGFFLKKEDAESLLTYKNNVEVLEKASAEIT